MRMLSQYTGKIYNVEETNECLMEVGKTGIEADHSNSTGTVPIVSLSARTLLMTGMDKITKVKVEFVGRSLRFLVGWC